MRGVIGGRINNPNDFILPNITKQTAFFFCSGSSGSGRGRGGGLPTGSSPFERFTPSKPLGEPAPESKSYSQPQPQPRPSPSGSGHGRGQPSAHSSQPIPAFTSFLSTVKSGCGRGRASSVQDPSESPRLDAQTPKPRTFTPTESGRGRVSFVSDPDELTPQDAQVPTPRTFTPTESGHGRVSFVSDPNEYTPQDAQAPKPRTFSPTVSATDSTQPSEPILSPSITSVLPVAGRGMTAATHQQQQQSPPRRLSPPIKEENRHIRAPSASETGPVRPKLSREDAVKMAMKVLSRGDEGKGEWISTGGPGRGMGRGRGRGRGWGRGRGRMPRQEMEDDGVGRYDGLYLGDNADGEKLAEKVGAEKMNMLVEAFEEMSGRVLPSPLEDAYVDAFHTNCMIEFEPEYLMEEFGTNPDIDEKPPIPLLDALEKMKPFLMAYEGIQNQEEWEEAINEVMDRVPLLKEIVDHYSGPDTVTAKQQGEELESVAKTIPESAPASFKRFANRAVLSLQSNPGWGFDKKCQFMDKLAWEVSQHYK